MGHMGNRAGSRKRGFRGCMRPTDGNRRYLAGGLWSRGNKEAQTFLNVRRRTQSDPAPPVSSVCLQPHLVLLLPCSLNTSCLGGFLSPLDTGTSCPHVPCTPPPFPPGYLCHPAGLVSTRLPQDLLPMVGAPKHRPAHSGPKATSPTWLSSGQADKHKTRVHVSCLVGVC